MDGARKSFVCPHNLPENFPHTLRTIVLEIKGTLPTFYQGILKASWFKLLRENSCSFPVAVCLQPEAVFVGTQESPELRPEVLSSIGSTPILHTTAATQGWTIFTDREHLGASCTVLLIIKTTKRSAMCYVFTPKRSSTTGF